MPNPYLTFSSPNSFTLNVYSNTKYWNGTLEYSTDTTTWTVWDGTVALSSGPNNELYLRGTGNYQITGSLQEKCRWVLTGSEISCTGNIENLLDYQTVLNGQHPQMRKDGCYPYLFSKCSSLISSPELPATTLVGSCYYSMFDGCTSLTAPPELPATTLAESCYCYMFRGCTSLTASPELPATTLTKDCYFHMFQDCTSLTTPPELPATSLAQNCYAFMFGGCTSLKTPPELPATTLASSCYGSMFSGCTSLTIPPSLPATALAQSCYGNMFSNCTSLIIPSKLPATTLARYCYKQMFQGCTSIKLSSTQTEEYQTPYRIPSSGNCEEDALESRLNMFKSTGGTFAGTPLINTTYYLSVNASHGYVRRRLVVPHYLTFSSPSSFTLNVYDNVKHWGGTLEYSTDTVTWNTWDGTTTLSSGSNNKLYLRGTGNKVITGNSNSLSSRWVLSGSNISCSGNIETLLDYQTVTDGNHPTMGLICYSYMFYGCTALTTAPDLPATTLPRNCYSYMFYNCTSLTSAPILPATTLANYCYQSMFGNCTSLTTPPALPATSLALSCYNSMFYNCTSLATPPALPATTLAESCYRQMFYKCTSLTTAPELPATTLAENCYESMFRGCTSLTTAPELPATTLANFCYNYMFVECTSLTTAPALPATTLANSCYYQMFYGCTSLTTLPALPATTLADSCYDTMFYGCTSIKLSDTQTSEYNTPYRIPSEGNGAIGSNSLYRMFTSTGGSFKGTPTINTTYYTSNVVVPAS